MSLIRRLLKAVGYSARRRESSSDKGFAAGDIVSVVTEDGRFGVLKILVVDEGGVHARLYAQRFDERPKFADLGELSTAPSDQAATTRSR
jgi:hypothetical protein